MTVDGEYLVAWAKAFVLTEVVETPIYRFAVPTTVWWGLAASAITHPFVWFLFPWLGERTDADYLTTTLVSEVFAWVVEAVFFVLVAKTRWRRALAVSFAANAASVAIGLSIRATLGIV